jgi:hypothetical protein
MQVEVIVLRALQPAPQPGASWDVISMRRYAGTPVAWAERQEDF